MTDDLDIAEGWLWRDLVKQYGVDRDGMLKPCEPGRKGGQIAAGIIKRDGKRAAAMMTYGSALDAADSGPVSR